MERRKFLIGVGSFAAAGAAAMGTGAFTSVEADRGIEVTVEGDDAAFLRLQPADKLSGEDLDSAPNGAYAEQTGDEETVEINLDDDARGVAGSGLNPEATTTICEILAVTNDGTQGVGLSVDVNFNSSLGDGEYSVLASSALDECDDLSSDLEAEGPVDVDVGETVFLGAEITTGQPAELDGTVTFTADAADYSGGGS